MFKKERAVFWVIAAIGFVIKVYLSLRTFRLALMTYVGAETESGALEVLGKLLNAGFNIISDPLGEFTSDPSQMTRIRELYIQHIDRLGDLHRAFPLRKVSIAVKPSRLGTFNDGNELADCLVPIVTLASVQGVFVWLDAEKRESLETILQAVLRLDAYGYYNIGLAVQAMHSFSVHTAKELAERSIPMRVVKGAYADGDIRDKDIRNQFAIICRTAASTWPWGSRQLAIGTHDQDLIRRVSGTCPDAQIEYQFLYGVRTALQEWYLSRGETTTIYMPWGTFKEARGYFFRRLKEGIRPSTLVTFARNIFEARSFRKKYLS